MKTTLEEVLHQCARGTGTESILILDSLESSAKPLLKLLSDRLANSVFVNVDRGEDPFDIRSSKKIPLLHSLTPSLFAENSVSLFRRLFHSYPILIASLHLDCHEEEDEEEELISNLTLLFHVTIKVLSSNKTSITLEISKDRNKEKEVVTHDSEKILRIARLPKGKGHSVIEESLPVSMKNITTFNLNLDEKEKQERDELVMPYWTPEQKSTVQIHKKTVEENKIYYEADSGDDEDEDDPDYDLDF